MRGGQKQRAAAARALITALQLILEDESTRSLDSKATDSLLHLFDEINEDGQTILMVTHSTKAACGTMSRKRNLGGACHLSY